MQEQKWPFRARSALLLLVVLACTARCSPHEAPNWLMGLQELLQQEQPGQQVHVASVDADTVPNHTPLLRPHKLSTLPNLGTKASLQSVIMGDGAWNDKAAEASVTLASVAATYAVSSAYLQDFMLRDEQLLVTPQGLLVWSCSSSPHGHHDIHGHAHMDSTDSSSSQASSGGGATNASISSLADTSQDSDGISSSSDARISSVSREDESQDGVISSSSWLSSSLLTHWLAWEHSPPNGAAGPQTETSAATVTVAGAEADSNLKVGTNHAADLGLGVHVVSDEQYEASLDDGDADGASFITTVLPPMVLIPAKLPDRHMDDPLEPAAPVTAQVATAAYAPEGSAPQTADARWLQQQQPRPDDAFKLHSNAQAAAKHTIFLDFKGCSVTNTYWNAATNKPVLQTEPFDLDGDVTSFSQQERQAIVDIWLAVVQDFAPWDVDVTTEDPGQEALIRSNESDELFGMHVCIGGSSSSTVGGFAGGLAFTGSWGQMGPGLQPVLVFPKQLGNGHPRAVADSISHEVGHTFGLAHFGGSGTAPYNEGNGPWGPLLGLPYSRTLSQWSKGMAVSGSVQDDVALISSHLTALPDDHGNHAAAATTLCPRQAAVLASVSSAHHPVQSMTCKHLKQVAADVTKLMPASSSEAGFWVKARVAGTISHVGDQDWYSADVRSPGQLRVQLQLPASDSGFGINNLLAAVTIMGSDGKVLASAQPVNGDELTLEARVLVDIPGKYYLAVMPTSVPGISSYGSLGDYVLVATFPAAATVAVDATAVNSPAHDTVAPQLFSTKAPAGPFAHKCLDENCAPCQGCGHCANSGAQRTGHCSCSSARGLFPKLAALAVGSTEGTATASSTVSTCLYQEVKSLSFSSTVCNTAIAGSTVLLNFTVSSPPACFEGSILAAAPSTEQLPGCPCRQSPRRPAYMLPVPQQGWSLPADGSYRCHAGVYSYAWRTPEGAGCYRVTVPMADGGSVVTVLRVVERQEWGPVQA